MKPYIVLALCLGIGAIAVAESPPEVRKGFVTRPEFTTTEGRFGAGTAFAVEVDGAERRALLSAVHLFGSAGGLDREIPPKDLPGYVREVTCVDAFDGDQVGGASSLVPLPNASSMNESPGAGDIVAFRIPEGQKFVTAPLAKESPRPGERVWLAAQVLNRTEARRFEAKVVGIADSRLYYAYEDPKLELRATSGAAVLNARGEAVGINLGGGESEGVLYGIANPVENFRAALVEAMRARP